MMHWLLTLFKHKQLGQHKGGNHPRDVGEDHSGGKIQPLAVYNS